ncbi:MAG: sulfur carrier protein ThiS [Candidatus Accumulibacter sp.]|jgi:sulfur carrier protein|nr:sulfur carrier protein ThiS [Accumulibacter sp.]
MRIVINGDDKTFAQGTLSISELLEIENVSQPDQVSVQVNGEFLRSSLYGTIRLKEGDAVDFLYFMGGGR